ncbi:hypothetical protein F4782DRAFT_552581 [Xylaria castorea]|nr:hypothetical protein F4782DRAFT_552581 [Xylaria castorea]
MTTMSYRDFITSQESMKGPPTHEQLSALETFFSSSQTHVSEVAKAINRPYHKAIRENPDNRVNPAESQCSRIWRTLNNAVKQLPECTDRVAELVVEMLQISDPLCANVCSQDFKQEWTEFAWDFKQPSSTDPDREVKCQAWVNMNVFCARLSTYDLPKVDITVHADWIMRNTLEKTPWEAYHHPDIDELESFKGEDFPAWREYELEKRGIKSLDYWVPGAAAWFKINAQGIFELQGPMRHEHNWNATNWKGPKGWSKDRFSYWGERFEWISKVTALEKRTRVLAKEVAEIIKRVEGDAA